ncbi:glutamine-hydrolyzing carbamoyl-phosphate synthase small subunit [Pseudomonadota bacterium]
MKIKKQDAVLIFPDEKHFYGYGIGKKGYTQGEICFNTSMTGYQEILTDPSYMGQIITFTFPHIGNIGTNSFDIESNKPIASGLIVRAEITNPSSFRNEKHLNEYLKNWEMTGISGVDTREITVYIREKGAKTVGIVYSNNIKSINIKKYAKKLRNAGDLGGKELGALASQNRKYNWANEGIWNSKNNSYNSIKDKKYKVVAIDYGAKLNILRCLTEVGCNVTVLPAKATLEDVLKHEPNGVFLSNGPGDPSATGEYTIPMIQGVVKKGIPLFGICLGHQLLALAMGGTTSKMYQGHRGANHPVKNLKENRVEIASQNHGFCVNKEDLPDNLEITHISLFDDTVEGIKVKGKPAFSVQYHPESSPGPHDSFYLFRNFVDMMEGK